MRRHSRLERVALLDSICHNGLVVKDIFRVLSFAKNLWPYYTVIIVFSVLMSLTALATPFIIKLATDLIVHSLQSGHADVSGALWLAIALFVVDLLNTLFTNWGGYLGDVMSVKLREQLSNRYYEHLMKLPQRYYDEELTGTIINRLNRTITEITQFLNMFANNFFQMFLTMFLTLVIVAFYSWELALLLCVLYPVFMWLTTKTSKKWSVWQAEKNLAYDLSSGRFGEVISQVRVVKSFLQEQLELKQFAGKMQETVAITHAQSRYWHTMDVTRRSALSLIFFAIFAYLFITTAQGRFTLGEMVLLIQLVNMMRFPIFNMSFIVDNTQKAIAGSVDYFSVMAHEPEVADVSGAKKLSIKKGAIRYDDVSFGYDSNARVLKNVSFVVKPGQKIALVGESGEGKSTITNLLLRLYDADSGHISIDDTDIRSVTQKSLREQIAVVFQEPALFSGTIRENIAYANPRATDKQVIAAAKNANAHDFITKLANGYDSLVGERGIKLSGGQKQRIAIARAVLKNAPILLLDEATSSLDSKAEAQVQAALESLMKGRTTIVVAHRLSTIAHVDSIVTLKNGTVDEIGSPAALAKTDGIYAQLLALQLGNSEKARKALQKYGIIAS